MNRIFLILSFSICFIAFGFNASAQVCVPDTQYTAVGFYPNPLPPGCVGQAYNEVIHFVFPDDTVIPIVGTVPFDSFIVVSITNIPNGLSYACNVTSCKYITAPPTITRGCVVVSGTPTVASNDSVLISAKAYFGGTGQSFTIPLEIGLPINAQPCGTATQPDLAKQINLGVAPNPVGSSSRISFTLPKSEKVNITLSDITGRELTLLQNENLSAGLHQVDFSIDNQPAGVYFIKFSLTDAHFVQSVKVLKF